jgi:hypothetical protein
VIVVSAWLCAVGVLASDNLLSEVETHHKFARVYTVSKYVFRKALAFVQVSFFSTPNEVKLVAIKSVSLGVAFQAHQINSPILIAVSFQLLVQLVFHITVFCASVQYLLSVPSAISAVVALSQDVTNHFAS